MAPREGPDLVRISRPIVVFGGLALVGGGILAAVVIAPRTPPGPSAPVVYYEVLDARRLSLLEQPLDGTTEARIVASRPSTGEGQVRWEVDPSGGVALAFTLTAGGSVVEGVEIEGGRTLWREELDRHSNPGVWSRDGRQWASTTETPDGEQDQLVVIDVAAGTTGTARAERGWWPQGFTANGDLVLSEEIQGPDGRPEAWRFRLLDRATGAVTPVDAGVAATGPRSKGSSDVSTEGRRALRTVQVDDPKTGGSAERLEAFDLRTGDRGLIGPAEDTNYQWIALTPDASRVLALTHVGEVDGQSRNALLVMNTRGDGVEVWRGPNPIDEVISREGRYLGLTAWERGPVLTVVHLGSGHSAEIPLPQRTIAAAIRAIVDPADVDVIAVAPLRPSASAAPTVAAEPLSGGPMFLATSFERTADDKPVGRVSILAPGRDGGVAVIKTMPPLDLQAADGFVVAHPRPGSDEILIEVGGEAPSRYWLWTPGATPIALELPDDLPAGAGSPHWRPDGGAIAFQFYRPVVDSTETGVAILELASGNVRVIQLTSPYPLLGGWADDGRRLLLDHDVCVEGCPGRFAYRARLDPDSGAITPFDAGDRDAGGAAYVVYPDLEQRTIILTSIEDEDADDVVLRWPADLAMPSGAWIEWSPDYRDLQVASTIDDVTTIYVVRDVLGRGAGTFDARPIEMGGLPEGLTPRSLSGDRAWVIAADRAATTFLVRIASGKSWEIGPVAEGVIIWLPDD